MVTPNQEAMDEWYEHPVTAYLLELLRQRAQVAADNMTAAYIPGNPYKTSEVLAGLTMSFEELEFIHECIKDGYLAELEPVGEDDGE